MFFILSKVFYFFLQPLVWVLVILLLYRLTKSPIWKKRFFISLVSVLIIFSNPALLKVALYFWEVHATKNEEVGHYDVALVLGGMVEWDNDAKRVSCRRGVDRLWQTIQLYKAGKLDKILISGDSGYVFGRDLNEAVRLKLELINMGISEKDILVETKSVNTYENALYSSELIESNGFDEVLLVTSARHMRRASAVFDKLNIKHDSFSTDQYTGGKLTLYWDEYFIPQVSTFAEWTDLFKEVIGYVVYDLKGYI